MTHPVFDFLAQRSSTPISAISEPAPEGAELDELLKVAARVPDHGRLTPWRFILYRGDVRHKVGEYLAKRAEEREGPLPDSRKGSGEGAFCARTTGNRCGFFAGRSRAHSGMGAVSVGRRCCNEPLHRSKCAWLCHQLDHQLVFQRCACTRLSGDCPNERVAGFVHIGTAENKMPERPRADMEKIVSVYSGPWTE